MDYDARRTEGSRSGSETFGAACSVAPRFGGIPRLRMNRGALLGV